MPQRGVEQAGVGELAVSEMAGQANAQPRTEAAEQRADAGRKSQAHGLESTDAEHDGDEWQGEQEALASQHADVRRPQAKPAGDQRCLQQYRQQDDQNQSEGLAAPELACRYRPRGQKVVAQRWRIAPAECQREPDDHGHQKHARDLRKIGVDHRGTGH